MVQVNVTEFRQNLPTYLARVAEGECIQITVHGRVVARLEADVGDIEEARRRLEYFRAHSTLGDVFSPGDELWTGDHDHL